MLARLQSLELKHSTKVAKEKKNFYFFGACFFGLLATIYAEAPANSGCLEKETAITSIETAEDLLTKAKDNFPSCKEDENSKNGSNCAGKKALAYIEISKKLISDVRKNFPECPQSTEKLAMAAQSKKLRNCLEILRRGRTESGVYTIWVGDPFPTGKPLQVYCDMETDAGGWTVIQRRGKFPVQLDFNKDWKSYTNGFGNVTEEFWLGNENIRILCLKGCEIRFDLQDEDGEKGFALYQNFSLSNSNYRLNISGYAGNIAKVSRHRSQVRLLPFGCSLKRSCTTTLNHELYTCTALSRFVSGHLRSCSFSHGNKVFPVCAKCGVASASPEHILSCLRLSRETFETDPLLALDFLRAKFQSKYYQTPPVKNSLILSNAYTIFKQHSPPHHTGFPTNQGTADAYHLVQQPI
ncbi:Techylectin-5A [Araneus ventricosus]|uniref:Techylectin-5A n=1 Tax=Araneus ventricosus TaxID=182803 RepID=A0A4Y2QLC8_ARAVE|nr:Techylectin-5A [Araneus ventricosus]